MEELMHEYGGVFLGVITAVTAFFLVGTLIFAKASPIRKAIVVAEYSITGETPDSNSYGEDINIGYGDYSDSASTESGTETPIETPTEESTED